ncbi:MAG: hypothetical protein AAGC55_15310 [Myxococcota bacterium]
MSHDKPESPQPPAGEPPERAEPTAATDEPRVGDLLHGRVSEEQLDPATIAQLAAWFGAPAQAIVDAERAAGASPGRDPAAPQPPSETPPPREAKYSDPALRELWRRRYRAMDAVAPDFLAELESWAVESDELLHLPEPMDLNIESSLAKFDFQVWRLTLLDVREYERPESVWDALSERAPQAVLRDLHRPVLSWSPVLMPNDLGVDWRGSRSYSRVNALMRASYRATFDSFQTASALAREGFKELRSRLAEPWENSVVPEEKRRSSSFYPTLNDMQWFGSGGYDPTL